MGLGQKARALSEIEVKTLEALAGNAKTVSEIKEKAGIPLDSVRRALAWLKEKGLVKIGKGEETLVLNERGVEAGEKGIPARKLVLELKKLGGKAGIFYYIFPTISKHISIGFHYYIYSISANI